MRFPLILAATLTACLAPGAFGHDVITTKVTFNREIVRIVNAHCATCHREKGRAFSLLTYEEARPWAKAIAEETLRRRMPPWGAIKGFGDFRNDRGLSQEQLELIVDWVEGGAPEGDPKDLPTKVDLPPAATAKAAGSKPVTGTLTLTAAMRLDGLWPKLVPEGASFQMTAQLPDGSITPLLWVYEYRKNFNHPYLLRAPLDLPAGTIIRGVPAGANVLLLPAT